MLEHEGVGDRPRHAPGADEVIAHHGFKALDSDIAGGGNVLAAGVVDEHVEAAPGVPNPRERRGDGGRLANVGGERERIAATCFDRGRGFEQRRLASSHHGNARPGPRQRQRGRTADPGALSGDQRTALRQQIGCEAGSRSRELIGHALDLTQ